MYSESLFKTKQSYFWSILKRRSQDLDQFSTVNQTNLALKGIIGIGAMSKISYSTGHSNDGDNFQVSLKHHIIAERWTSQLIFRRYQNIASSYIQQWQNLTMSSDKSHLRMAFGQDQTSGLMYNLYADKLLNLNLVPSEVRPFGLRYRFTLI